MSSFGFLEADLYMGSVTVIFPAALLDYTCGAKEVNVAASNVSELLERLGIKFPGLKERVCTDAGSIRRFVNVFVNEEIVPHASPTRFNLKDGDVVHILPSIAGGAIND